MWIIERNEVKKQDLTFARSSFIRKNQTRRADREYRKRESRESKKNRAEGESVPPYLYTYTTI